MHKTDMHIHTNISNDGEFTPEEIVELAKKADLSVIAITDHNSSSGVQRAAVAAEGSGIKVISGIEIDCVYEGINLHLLGYHINHDFKVFKDLEKNIYNQEMNAFDLKAEKMKKLGLKVDVEKILKHAGHQAPSGELIGEVIMEDPANINHPALKPYFEGGGRSDMPLLNFYWDFFAQGKTGYVPIKYPSFFEAKEMIVGGGGVTVIAHPGNNFKNNMDKFEKLATAKIIEGVEVFSNYHTLSQVEYFYKKSVQEKLLITCGSDFHGKIKPLIKLGEFGEIKGFEEFFNTI